MASGGIVGIIGAIVPPATLGASEDWRPDASSPVANLPVYDFDDAQDEYLDLYGRLEGYAGGGLTVSFDWSATSASTNVVAWQAAFRRIEDDNEDMDTSHTYDYNPAAEDTAPSASGERSRVSIAFTNGSDMDSLADGEAFVFRVKREVTTSGTNMSGDAELWAFTLCIKET